MERYLHRFIRKDLDRKMVFLSGPRQVGKTTLARSLGYAQVAYLNYDNAEDRLQLRRAAWRRDSDLLILDEVHKHKRWKPWLKGIYDTEGIPPRIIVTGSAKLDVYRRGGDSLAGRYLPYRLHPLSVAELAGQEPARESLEKLLVLGGFPEPYLLGSEVEAARWRRTYVDRIVREDVVDLERVKELQELALLVELLAHRVGSTISYASLASDLEVAPNTVKNWLRILEALYVIFIVTPYSKQLTKAIRRQPKVYFFDVGYVKAGAAARLENVVALALLKHNAFLEDTRGETRALHFLRDRNGREVDFCVTKDETPELLVEVKSGAPDVKHLHYFHQRLGQAGLRAICVCHDWRREADLEQVEIRTLAPWLATLAA